MDLFDHLDDFPVNQKVLQNKKLKETVFPQWTIVRNPSLRVQGRAWEQDREQGQ